jgi:hypothetical protein
MKFNIGDIVVAKSRYNNNTGYYKIISFYENENKEPYMAYTHKVMNENGKIHKTIIKKNLFINDCELATEKIQKKQEMLNNIFININKLGSLKG